MDLLEEIKTIITGSIEGAKVVVADPRNDGVHLEAVVVSDQFEKMSLIKRHRMVMTPLKNQFATTLHALALKTYTQKEWEEKQS